MATRKIVTYRSNGDARAGIVVDDGVLDAASTLGDARYSTVLGILGDWDRVRRALATRIQKNQATVPLASVNLLAPVLYPSAIYCAGANYTDHMSEMSRVLNLPEEPDPHAAGLQPWHFIKASRTVVGPDAEVKLPAYSRKVDWEAELVAVIGRPAKDVAIERALDFVAGYTIANDLSARDFITRPGVAATSPFKYDWISQKSWDTSCPVGPWIVLSDDVDDPQNLAISLSVNGAIKQDSHTRRMIFTAAEQISQLSSRLTLHPGDLVLTGTPAGVGLARGEFLKSGDVCAISIEKIGTLTNRMV
jgi:2-keto-4-pentenoate hydratase/2-oxohepta-3-ene-1,7-dioic acid hydratase in catechol pathway